MKILLINLILHTAEKGVIPRHESNRDCMIYTMARGFVANGHEVTLLASDEYRPTEQEENPFEVIYFPSRMPRLFRPDLLPWPKGLLGWLKENASDYDLIVSSETFSMATLAASLVAPEKTVIWQELAQHQRMLKESPSRFWHDIVAPLTMKKCTVIGRSEKARDFMRRYLPNVADETVDHGCDSSKFRPDPEAKADDAFIIISQLIERKQPDRMLAAFLDFIRRPEFADYKLHVVGRGPLEENMRKMVEAAGAQRNVIFHGFLSQAEFAPLSRKSKGMLVNTLRDLNMVSIPESVANGTPVLLNTVPYVAPFIAGNRLGLVADDWGADELAEMARNHEEFHDNCVSLSPTLTNVGASSRIIDIDRRMRSPHIGNHQINLK